MLRLAGTMKRLMRFVGSTSPQQSRGFQPERLLSRRNHALNREFPEIHKYCGGLGRNLGWDLCLAGTLAHSGHTSQHSTERASKTSAPQRKYAKMLPRAPRPVKLFSQVTGVHLYFNSLTVYLRRSRAKRKFQNSFPLVKTQRCPTRINSPADLHGDSRPGDLSRATLFSGPLQCHKY
jgi:hypothetical protein